MTFEPLNTKDGDKFVCKQGRIWTAKWIKDSNNISKILTVTSPPMRGAGHPTKIFLGDFAHAFEAEGMTPIEAPPILGKERFVKIMKEKIDDSRN